jgi:SAM-dependent methyltransferase
VDEKIPPDTPPSPDEVLRFYETLPDIYSAHDRWLQVTHNWIRGFIAEECKLNANAPQQSCLNLGSGGLSYGLPEHALLHVDLHAMRFSPDQNVLLADIQKLPAFQKRFGHCLCVGSVINHCDAAAVIARVSDVLQPGGTFIIDFETSASLELFLSRHFNQQATVIRTFYHDRLIRLWAYSERYIRALLETSGFTVIRRSSCHHLSPLVYLIFRQSNFAAHFHVLDRIARRLPVLRACASHVIFACQRV